MSDFEASNALRVDLSTGEVTEKFASSPVFEKFAVVTITHLTPGTIINTVLSNGVHETTKVSQVGDVLVKNPGGEEYLITQEKFLSRYTHLEGDSYKAKGRIRAFRNPVGFAVVITAPWGSDQYGDRNCWFAIGLDEEGNMKLDDRYIIGGDEFEETYKEI